MLVGYTRAKTQAQACELVVSHADSKSAIIDDPRLPHLPLDSAPHRPLKY